MTSQTTAASVEPAEAQDPQRRNLAMALLGALGGAAFLEACAADPTQPSPTLASIEEALTSGSMKWVATVLGAAPVNPPANRPGDLAQNDATAVGANVVIAEGCITPNDGGGGIFVWSASGTDDGGTIIVPGASTHIGSTGGCWKRLYSAPINVKWFGATGDGTTHDAVAIQAAINAAADQTRTPPNLWIYTPGPPGLGGPGLGGGPTVMLPAGKYFVEATVELPVYMRLVGESDAMLYSSNATTNLLRIAGYHNHIENLAFGAGRSAIVFYGHNAAGGNIGTATAPSTNTITNCVFQANNGPSILQDTTVENRVASASVFVTQCTFNVSCAFFGAFDHAAFRDCWGNIDQSGLSGNGIPLVNDDNGNILPAFVSGDHLSLINVALSGNFFSNTVCAWVGGNAEFALTDSRLGDGIACLVRVKNSFTYNAVSLHVDTGTRPIIHVCNCVIATRNDIDWLELYDAFPMAIDVRMTLLSLPDSLGVWVNSTLLPFLNGVHNREDIQINFQGTVPQLIKFRASSDPSSATSLQINDLLRQFFVHPWPNQRASDSSLKNYFLPGITRFSQNTGGSIASGISYTTPLSDGSTGYPIDGLVSARTTDDGFFSARFLNWGSGIPAGRYCLSMYVKSSYPGKIWVSLDDGQHTIGFVDFDGGSQWQRIWMPFWHDGSAKTIVIGSYNMPAGGTIYYGLWQINKGSTPGIYQYPGNATTEEVLLSEYRGSTAPAAGTYAVGDIVRSPTPSLSTGVGWICVSGGTPGTWLPLYPELRTTQAPTTGTYQLGDRAWSSNPAAGFPMGWVCVASGSPGTWRAMPNL